MSGTDWTSANQRHLMAALDRVRTALERHAKRGSKADIGETIDTAEAAAAVDGFPAERPPALTAVAGAFGLSDFEQQILLLCAGVELDTRFGGLYAAAQGDPKSTYPTFSLALAALPDAEWNALSPDGPLRRWRLIEVGDGPALTTSALRIDERILCCLTGLQPLDPRLHGVVEPLALPAALLASQRDLAMRAVAGWEEAPAGSKPLIQLFGPDADGQRAVALMVGELLDHEPLLLPVHALPSGKEELAVLLLLWRRECRLVPRSLVLDLRSADSNDSHGERFAQQLARQSDGPIIVTTHRRARLDSGHTLSLEVPKPTPEERAGLWRAGLDGLEGTSDALIEELVSEFELSAPAIESASRRARVYRDMGRNDCTRQGKPGNETEEDVPKETQFKALLWTACREQVRPRLGSLVDIVEPMQDWKDLVLPKAQEQILLEILAQVRNRRRVYEDWGFAAKSRRGLGISALFVGPTGTGKTLAAEVLAGKLGLDLYRIDLSQVVSKFIGETEKNLSRVFDAAEEGSAVLLFDESDALFGKRTEVSDSHDRYANIEVSYLLQRMESYRGLAILTSNMKDALDPAFLRRLRFIVRFPFPDAELRERIWERIVPKQLAKDLDFAKLGQLKVAGGSIRNIALNAAFLAADEAKFPNMTHVRRAASSEYIKLEKSLTDNETRGWV